MQHFAHSIQNTLNLSPCSPRMVEKTRFQRPSAMVALKTKQLAAAKAEKAEITVRVKLLKDAVEACSRALSKERAKRIRAWTPDDDMKDVPVPTAKRLLAIKDEEHTGDDEDIWQTVYATWADMSELFKRLNRTPLPDGAVCCGPRPEKDCVNHTLGVHRVGVNELKKWPEDWGRERVSFLSYPLL